MIWKVLSKCENKRDLRRDPARRNTQAKSLSPEQYEENVATKPGSKNVVEFAVKMPMDEGRFVYLPIDSKFPADTYSALRDAYDSGDAERSLPQKPL